MKIPALPQNVNLLRKKCIIKSLTLPNTQITFKQMSTIQIFSFMIIDAWKFYSHQLLIHTQSTKMFISLSWVRNIFYYLHSDVNIILSTLIFAIFMLFIPLIVRHVYLIQKNIEDWHRRKLPKILNI
jgi:hypothetical protein